MGSVGNVMGDMGDVAAGSSHTGATGGKNNGSLFKGAKDVQWNPTTCCLELVQNPLECKMPGLCSLCNKLSTYLTQASRYGVVAYLFRQLLKM